MTSKYTVRIGRVGNSMRIVIPKPVIEGMGWDEGTELTLTEEGGRLLIQLETGDARIAVSPRLGADKGKKRSTHSRAGQV